MLFHLTEEIIGAAEEKNPDAVIIIEEIARSYRLGNHLVFTERKLLDRLINIPNYNNKETQQIFTHIKNKYATHGNIINQISLKVVFTLTEELKIIKDKENGRYKEIRLPVNQIHEFEIFGCSKLLGENITEIKFYSLICDFFKNKNGFTIPTKYFPLHGGGNTINEVLEEITNYKNCFCLAFLDSDKKYPDCEIGETLKKVKKSRKKDFCYFNTDYIYSDSYREVENLIPLSLLKEISKENPDWNKGYTTLETIFVKGGNIDYYDIKESVTEKHYSEITNPHYGEYVRKQLLIAGLKNEEELEAIKGKKEDKDTILLQGLGKKVLDRAIEYVKKNFPEWSQTPNLPETLEKEWERYGKEILNWTCAASPLRV
ncbi:hypothetical protein EZS27_012813 [termite gut metagenome]|uniref:Uncharacterized protein n=1 Tax=termite gut metagenome TaxID=433724 RepID=A0A5J4S201_9ZZZZ